VVAQSRLPDHFVVGQAKGWRKQADSSRGFLRRHTA
jgi:hypothetical protein